MKVFIEEFEKVPDEINALPNRWKLVQKIEISTLSLAIKELQQRKITLPDNRRLRIHKHYHDETPTKACEIIE